MCYNMQDVLRKEKRFIDIYFVQKDFSLDDCTLQKEEVEDVCLVSAEQLLNAGNRSVT